MFPLYSGPGLLVSLFVVDVILSLLHVAVICRRVCRAWFWPWLHVLACWTLPWVPEFFLVCDGNFRCWPKADTSSAVGRSHEFRAGHCKPETALEKSLAPKVVEHAPVTFSGMCAARGFLAETRSCCTPLCDYCTWFCWCFLSLLHVPAFAPHLILPLSQVPCHVALGVLHVVLSLFHSLVHLDPS